MSGSQNKPPPRPPGIETLLVTAGRDTAAQRGFVNPPVIHGSTVLYPTAEELRRVTGALATPRLAADVEVPLTQRESEVLRQLAYGLTNKEIALALHISYETVKEHVQHILRKIGVTDRTQAAVWAVRKSLV